jgi:hypothetical protein
MEEPKDEGWLADSALLSEAKAIDPIPMELVRRNSRRVRPGLTAKEFIVCVFNGEN